MRLGAKWRERGRERGKEMPIACNSRALAAPSPSYRTRPLRSSPLLSHLSHPSASGLAPPPLPSASSSPQNKKTNKQGQGDRPLARLCLLSLRGPALDRPRRRQPLRVRARRTDAAGRARGLLQDRRGQGRREGGVSGRAEGGGGGEEEGQGRGEGGAGCCCCCCCCRGGGGGVGRRGCASGRHSCCRSWGRALFLLRGSGSGSRRRRALGLVDVAVQPAAERAGTGAAAASSARAPSSSCSSEGRRLRTATRKKGEEGEERKEEGQEGQEAPALSSADEPERERQQRKRGRGEEGAPREPRRRRRRAFSLEVEVEVTRERGVRERGKETPTISLCIF